MIPGLSTVVRSVETVTRSPTRTVMWPSTCGMIADDPRDLSVATYSLLSSTATDWATWILTGMPGGPWACGPFRQARDRAASNTTRRSPGCLTTVWFIGAGPRT